MTGTFQGVSPLPNYVPPIAQPRPLPLGDGIIEYLSDAHCGSLKGDSADLELLDRRRHHQGPAERRRPVRPAKDASPPGFDEPLPLGQGPDGTIFVGEFTPGQVTALTPENIGCWAPRAHAPGRAARRRRRGPQREALRGCRGGTERSSHRPCGSMTRSRLLDARSAASGTGRGEPCRRPPTAASSTCSAARQWFVLGAVSNAAVFDPCEQFVDPITRYADGPRRSDRSVPGRQDLRRRWAWAGWRIPLVGGCLGSERGRQRKLELSRTDGDPPG